MIARRPPGTVEGEAGLTAVIAFSLLATGCSALEETADTAGVSETIEARAGDGGEAEARAAPLQGLARASVRARLPGLHRLHREELAREYGLKARPKRVARYSQRLYRPAFRRAAYAGCLDGFMRRPPGIR